MAEYKEVEPEPHKQETRSGRKKCEAEYKEVEPEPYKQEKRSGRKKREESSEDQDSRAASEPPATGAGATCSGATSGEILTTALRQTHTALDRVLAHPQLHREQLLELWERLRVTAEVREWRLA